VTPRIAGSKRRNTPEKVETPGQTQGGEPSVLKGSINTGGIAR